MSFPPPDAFKHNAYTTVQTPVVWKIVFFMFLMEIQETWIIVKY